MTTFIKNDVIAEAVTNQIQEIVNSKPLQLPQVFMLHDLALKGLQAMNLDLSEEDINGALRRLGKLSSGENLRKLIEFSLSELADSLMMGDWLKDKTLPLLDMCLGSGSTTSWQVNGVVYSGYYAVPLIIYAQPTDTTATSYVCEVSLDEDDEE